MPKEMICDNCACSIHDDYSDDYFEAKKTIEALTKRDEHHKERIKVLAAKCDELTKENDFHRKNESDMVKALTEQVEKLKEINTDLEETNAKLVVAINPREAELSRLREERKELVEALRELILYIEGF